MGSFGGAHVIPLWRDAPAATPNVNVAALEEISKRLGVHVSAADLFSYCFAILAAPEYVSQYWEELRVPGPRVPLTLNPRLFSEVAALGRMLVHSETFGLNFADAEKHGQVPAGRAKCLKGTSGGSQYPKTYSYNPELQRLEVGAGVFEQVRQEVWEFRVSGLQVVDAWLSARLAEPSGKTSSELDSILPKQWTFDLDLLDLLWVVDNVIDLQPRLNDVLAAVLAGALIDATSLPAPLETERGLAVAAPTTTLF
jgi:hypothetical protein